MYSAIPHVANARLRRSRLGRNPAAGAVHLQEPSRRGIRAVYPYKTRLPNITFSIRISLCDRYHKSTVFLELIILIRINHTYSDYLYSDTPRSMCNMILTAYEIDYAKEYSDLREILY